MVSVLTLGGHRPPSAHWPHRADSLRDWRLNLIQFASTHNLLFVAHGPRLAIYEPSFPSQRLAELPSLVIDTPPTAAGLGGYIDTGQPRTINNVLVDRFGAVEVVVVVRDDGDVDAYLTHQLHRALLARRAAASDATATALNASDSDLRPFLHRNVGASAWGIAVHGAARMIAVSSNNHEINIFALALLPGPDRPSRHRDSDEHIRIPNGEANIPCINFCNSGRDPDGSWLLTVDISGLARAWHLPTLRASPGLSLGCRPRLSSLFDPRTAGWLVDFIDPRTFVDCTHSSAIQFDLTLPVWDQVAVPQLDTPAPDSTSCLYQVADGSARRTSGRSTGISPAEPPSTLTRPPPQSSLHVDRQLAHVEVCISGRQEHTFLWRRTRPPPSAGPLFSRDGHLTAEDSDADADADVDRSMEDVLLAGPPPTTTRQSIPAPITRDPRHDPEEEDDDDTDGAVFVKYLADGPLCPSIPCPVLYASVKDFYLLQPSTRPDRASVSDNFPIMAHRRPFARPSIDLSDRHWDLSETEVYARCSLSAQVPSLGVLVLGDQSGRVAVYVGVKARTHVALVLQRDRDLDRNKWVYGLRRSALLPTEEQERAGLRPAAQLCGLAVAPMQGSEGLPDDMKRWRLLLMYQDCTVLGYEIVRDGGGVAVEDVML